MEKMVESLVMEFVHAKYEEFLSSASKSPRVARQYRKVFSEICSQASSETSPRMAHVARVNVSHETRKANDNKGQSRHASPLKISQLQAIRGPQQSVKRNWNTECR